MDIYSAQRKIGEDLVQTMYERYRILELIRSEQPLGRRKITEQLHYSERQVRNHLDYLMEKNVVTIDKRGVLASEEADEVLPLMYDYFSNIFTYEKESRLQDLLKVKKVIISKGDSDHSPEVLNQMGKAAESYFVSQLQQNGVIAVSGGSTLKSFADQLRSIPKPNYTVVPVRGAMGISHSYQANTIAFYTSMKLGCEIFELNIPEMVEPELLSGLSKHPSIQAVTSKYQNIDILIFGVGKPDLLAQYRYLSEEEREKIKCTDCVAEAVGHYLNAEGEIVKKSSGIGLDIEDLKRIPIKIAIAGGSTKSKSIRALTKFMNDVILVTDEGCADELLNNKQTVE